MSKKAKEAKELFDVVVTNTDHMVERFNSPRVQKAYYRVCKEYAEIAAEALLKNGSIKSYELVPVE
jgi:predicted secreted protein